MDPAAARNSIGRRSPAALSVRRSTPTSRPSRSSDDARIARATCLQRMPQTASTATNPASHTTPHTSGITGATHATNPGAPRLASEIWAAVATVDALATTAGAAATTCRVRFTFTGLASTGTPNGSLKFSTSTYICVFGGAATACGFTKWLAMPASSAKGSSSFADAAIHIQ